MPRLLLVVLSALAVAGCGLDDPGPLGEDRQGGGAPTATPAPPPPPVTPEPVPEGERFGAGAVRLVGAGEEALVPAYVADEEPLRRHGLMGWEELPGGAGMLFVFDEERTGAFWMLDTLIPLSIAFADDDGEILAILDMEPCREEPCPTYDPGVAYRYALEVEQGRFEELGVEEGWRLERIE